LSDTFCQQYKCRCISLFPKIRFFGLQCMMANLLNMARGRLCFRFLKLFWRHKYFKKCEIRFNSCAPGYSTIISIWQIFLNEALLQHVAMYPSVPEGIINSFSFTPGNEFFVMLILKFRNSKWRMQRVHQLFNGRHLNF